jgi:hypothetical protein
MSDPRESDLYEAADASGNYQLTPSDTLTGDDELDPLDTGYSPPDREPRATRYGTTDDEELRGESLADKLAEEVPDISDDPVDEDYSYDDADEIAGRLVAPDEGAHADLESDAVARDGRAFGGESAEEAAIHIIEE